mgnify:CR=1 FL=1
MESTTQISIARRIDAIAEWRAEREFQDMMGLGPEAAQRGITFKTECPEDLPDINADPGMLQQALLNLALNACQAMPNGGTLRPAAEQSISCCSRRSRVSSRLALTTHQVATRR